MIVVNNPMHGHIIAEEAGAFFYPARHQVVARESSQGELLGGSVYTNYTGKSIAMHVASFKPNWINGNLLYATFWYPFIQLGVSKIIAQVPSYNERALSFDLGIGFKHEYTCKDTFPEGDTHVLSMYKDDCRWLKLKPRRFHLDYKVYEG